MNGILTQLLATFISYYPMSYTGGCTNDSIENCYTVGLGNYEEMRPWFC